MRFSLILAALGGTATATAIPVSASVDSTTPVAAEIETRQTINPQYVCLSHLTPLMRPHRHVLTEGICVTDRLCHCLRETVWHQHSPVHDTLRPSMRRSVSTVPVGVGLASARDGFYVYRSEMLLVCPYQKGMVYINSITSVQCPPYVYTGQSISAAHRQRVLGSRLMFYPKMSSESQTQPHY